MNKILQYVLIVCGILFIGMVFLGIIGSIFITDAIDKSITPKEYTIEVTGDRILFNGVISRMEYGTISTNSVSERIPETYTFTGVMTSVVFQKQNEYGKMTVIVKDSANNVIKMGTTDAPYGIVSITI